jgi:cysteinyl-tRNA synthetase
VKISNTLTGQKEDFTPGGDEVKLYVCGMTPKFHPHLGHARLFVAADVLRRYLEYRGYRVHHVQNFTDIDDKIIARAADEGDTPEAVARKYSDSYFAAMDALNVLRAHEYPTVTGVMPRIIAFVEGLIARGAAYVADGDVWFSVEHFPDYGALSGRQDALEEGLVGARKELEPGKRDPRDFALWKSAKPGEPAWDSPWGPGRPGWHIECSTMVRETLGDTIDIHGGGYDLLFPHHENERAQSEAFTGQPFVRYWAHIGLLTTSGGEKMSHSLLNFRTVQDVLEHYDPMAVRLYLLQTHYRAPLSFNEEALAGAARGLARLRAASGAPGQAPPVSPPILGRRRGPGDEVGPPSVPPNAGGEARTGARAGDEVGPPSVPPNAGGEARTADERGDGAPANPQSQASTGAAGAGEHEAPATPPGLGGQGGPRARFEAAMDDDFNTSAALAALFELAAELNARRGDPAAAAEVAEGQAVLRELAGVLGLDLAPRAGASAQAAEPFVELLLAVRGDLRAARQWVLADRIRDGLRELGVAVEDHPDGSTWRFE